jgi:hypothetical protein
VEEYDARPDEVIVRPMRRSVATHSGLLDPLGHVRGAYALAPEQPVLLSARAAREIGQDVELEYCPELGRAALPTVIDARDARATNRFLYGETPQTPLKERINDLAQRRIRSRTP